MIAPITKAQSGIWFMYLTGLQREFSRLRSHIEDSLVTQLNEGDTKKGRRPNSSEAVAFSADDVLKAVIDSLEDSKAEDLVPINIKNKSALGDHMVVASGRSQRHVSAISDHLIQHLKEAGFGNPKVEGLPNCDWVLVDAGDVIVHIFRPEVREFYSIEKMWLMPESGDQH